jgi:hypothetical protein
MKRAVYNGHRDGVVHRLRVGAEGKAPAQPMNNAGQAIQVSNLLYRRLPVGRGSDTCRRRWSAAVPSRSGAPQASACGLAHTVFPAQRLRVGRPALRLPALSGLETRGTADWKSAPHLPDPDRLHYPKSFAGPRTLSGGAGARLSPAAAAPPRRAPADWPTPFFLHNGCGSGDPRSACRRSAGWKPAVQQIGNLRYIFRFLTAWTTRRVLPGHAHFPEALERGCPQPQRRPPGERLRTGPHRLSCTTAAGQETRGSALVAATPRWEICRLAI